MGKTRASATLVALATMAWLIGAAVPAQAVPCGDGTLERFLVDADGWPWDLEADGEVDNGLGDAFDSYAEIDIGATAYPEAGADACTLEEGGREVVYPEATVGGLQVSRKVYVPDRGVGFARFLSILRNAGAAPVTTTYTLTGNLGSDGDTTIVTTSTGDATVSPADRWVVSEETADATADPEDPLVGTIVDGLAPGAAQTVSTTDYTNGDDSPEFEYNITVPPGGTLVFLHVVTQRGNRGAATAATAALAAGLPDVFVGMSSAELANLRNWVPPTCQGKAVTLFGTSSADTLTGTSAADVILAGDGDDRIAGLGGKDAICADAGNDRINGGGGNDRILGGLGNDKMNGGPGKRDVCKGGPGKDTSKNCEKGKP